MPKKQENIAKKKWYKVWWKSLLGIVGVITASLGILKGVYFFTEIWYEYTELQETVGNLSDEETNVDGRIVHLEDYVKSKKRSFAVGFRVFKEVDELTGGITYQKKYRDWNGVWNEVYIDKEYSDEYGVDYYFYIHKQTGDKIYCW